MLIGINIKSIKASINEKESIKDSININTPPPEIVDIEKKDINIEGIKDILGISFKFETIYEPKIGELAIEGEALYQTNETKDILNKWKKDKKLEDKVALEVLNAIYRKCMTLAFDLTEELRLPLPMKLPVFLPKELSEKSEK